MQIDGIKVVDAKKRLRIRITPADIRAASKGGRKNPGSCAAAQAAMRQFSGITEARFQIGRVYLKQSKPKQWIRYMTPMQLRSEIVAFDRGGQFEPGDYEIIAPTKAARLGSYQHMGAPNTHGPSKKSKHIMLNVRKLEGANKQR
jgi:hypothetical protein